MNIYFFNLGCPKNQVDLEMMMAALLAQGHEIASDVHQADAVLINTCSFINDAAEESINIITEMLEYKKLGHIKKVIVTGCLVERYKKELTTALPDVDIFTGVGTGQRITRILSGDNSNKDNSDGDNSNKDNSSGDNSNKDNSGNTGKGDNLYIFDQPSLTDPRIIINSSKTAYLRISEGCRKKCSYCIIPQIRGPLISIDPDTVLDNLKGLSNEGFKEIIIIAEDSTDYGKDFDSKKYKINTLAKLLLQMEKIPEIKWIRLLYLYPEGITPDLVNVIAQSKKIVPYLDIPFQHISKKVLKKMNRPFESDYLNLISTLRKRIKKLVLRTTFIVGFPGEDEQDFCELLDFSDKSGIENIGVFKYSNEDGTRAYNFPNQISDQIKTDRFNRIMQYAAEKSTEHLKKYIGKTLEVLIESYDTEQNIYLGRTAFQSPDIDGITQVKGCSQADLYKFIKVKITDSLTYDLIGEKPGYISADDNENTIY